MKILYVLPLLAASALHVVPQANAATLDNGRNINGVELNGRNINGRNLNGGSLNGRNVNGLATNGLADEWPFDERSLDERRRQGRGHRPCHDRHPEGWRARQPAITGREDLRPSRAKVCRHRHAFSSPNHCTRRGVEPSDGRCGAGGEGSPRCRWRRVSPPSRRRPRASARSPGRSARGHSQWRRDDPASDRCGRGGQDASGRRPRASRSCFIGSWSKTRRGRCRKHASPMRAGAGWECRFSRRPASPSPVPAERKESAF